MLTATKKAANPIDKHIGQRVRMRRMMLEMSQEKLADQLGLTFQQVQKYEKGANRIGGSRMQQIATVLQVPVGFFYEGQQLASHAAPSIAVTAELDAVNAFMATSQGVRIAVAFPKLDHKLRAVIVSMVEHLATQSEA